MGEIFWMAREIVVGTVLVGGDVLLADDVGLLDSQMHDRFRSAYFLAQYVPQVSGW